jgi:hypothetical protein
MPQVQYSRQFRVAVLVDEAFLQHIYNCVREYLPDTDCMISIETDGHTTVAANELAEVLAAETLQTDAIKKIEISARKYDPIGTRRMSFEIEKGESFRTCDVKIEGPDSNKVMAYRGRLEKLISSASLWYSIFRLNNYGASIFVMLLFSAAALGGILLCLKMLGLVESWTTIAINFVSWLLTTSFLLAAGGRKLFPSVVFNIGYSARMNDALAALRNVLFGVIGLGILVAIVASYLYDTIKAH